MLMTRTHIARRGFAALLAGSALLLAACGGGGGDDDSGGEARWRVVNLTSDVASIDAYTGNDKRFSAVASGAVTEYATLPVAGYNVKITAAGQPTTILGSAFTFSPSKDRNFTAVVAGRTGLATIATLLDGEDTSGVADGVARLRVYNAAIDSGTLDVYVTNAADISQITPTRKGTTIGAVGGFGDVASGTYRLRVTGADRKPDVRLDITGLVLDSKKAYTLVLTSGSSGSLVSAALIEQGGAVTLLANNSARLRVAAGAGDGGTVAVKVDGDDFGSAAISPTAGSYGLLGAGARRVTVTLNGATVSDVSRTFAKGGDYTLVVAGTPAAPQVQFLTDDNRLPAAGTYRLRLIHADASYRPLTVKLNGETLIGLESVSYGTTSPWTSGVSQIGNLAVSTVSPIDQLAAFSDWTLASQGVYTVFVLGGKDSVSNGVPTPIPTVEISRDR